MLESRASAEPVPMRTSSRLLSPCLLICLTVLAGCARTLMPTPNVHRDPDVDYFADVPPELRSNIVEIMYATDRLPSNAPGTPLKYGSNRSPSLAFGTARLRIGYPSLGWDELVAASRTERRSQLVLHFLEARELVRLPDTPWYNYLAADPSITEEQVRQRDRAGGHELQALLGARLREAAGGDVFIYIHGFNTTFDYGAMTLAELWHFLGRPGVPILYSWPAASAGVFGYHPDRESSEYTVSHLKRFIRVVAASDEVERIHLIAHSRGTDVLTSALRELHIHHAALGRDTAEALKLENVVLIAADLDIEVSNQRVTGEAVHEAAQHMTIYTGGRDRALDIASSMFKSRARLGQVDTQFVSESGRVIMDHLADHLTIIHQPRRIGFTGHKYYTSDPRVSSDLILLLRGHRRPGAEHGRPLEQDPSGVWIIPDGYPHPDG